jgi:transposase
VPESISTRRKNQQELEKLIHPTIKERNGGGVKQAQNKQDKKTPKQRTKNTRSEKKLYPPDECSAIHEEKPPACSQCGEELKGSDPEPYRHQINEKDRQTYYGALNYQTQELTVQAYAAGNGDSTVKFVKHLQDKYSGKKIILIWDGASYHRFGEFRDYLVQINNETAPDEWRITCVLFAPNAPQQNPIEDVWLQAKNFLRKYWHLCRSFEVVKILFELFTSGQKFDFPKVHSYYPADQLT